jgi:CRISPR type III-A-associated RAMP protein Csm4
VFHADDLPKEILQKVDHFFEEKTTPKIADHARQRTDNIYFQTDLHIKQTTIRGKVADEYGANAITIQPSFYFLLQDELPEDKKKYRNLLNLLLELLVDEGIGGGISTGCGRLLSIEQKAFSFDLPTAVNSAVSMSLISPTEADLATIQYATILTRGGRKIAAEESLDRVKMIREGACIQHSTQGSVVPIHGSKKFLRYGRAFPLPVHPNYE